jgi:xanthosine utilization system XapX-like protein
MRITRKFLRAQRACYTDEQIAALVPESGVTPLRCARGDIPPEDRVWVLTRPGVLPDSMLWEWTARTVERALSRVAKPDPRSLAVVPLLRRLAGGEQIPEAAWAAAGEAAWVAAWAAAGEAAGAAEGQAQIADVVQLLEATP